MASKDSDFAFVGGLRQDYYITHDGRSHDGILGGNAVYASIGAKLWSDSVSIISRVGSDYPKSWLDTLAHIGINIDGITTLAEPQDTRSFYAYSSLEDRVDTAPAAHYLKINQPLPKELVGYQPSTTSHKDQGTFNPLAIRPTDLGPQIAKAKGVHIAPADYLTHVSIPFRIRELGAALISLDPTKAYMEPDCHDKLPVIVNGLDAFLPSEADAIAYFRPREMSLWEMGEAFGDMGCRFVIIKCGARGQALWDRTSGRRWRIPAYPARVYDVTGAGDSFCGGFLVGLAQTEDPVEAALYGSVSASIVIEGAGALFALDSLPGLMQARLDTLRPLVKRA